MRALKTSRWLMLSLLLPMIGCADGGAARPDTSRELTTSPQEAEVSAAPAQESDVPKTPTTVSCNLVVNPDELKLSVASVSLSEEELEKLGGKWPNKQGKHDVEGLQKWLVSLKTRYPGSNTIHIAIEPTIKFEQVIPILDAVAKYDTAQMDEDGAPIFGELFPMTVISPTNKP